jgi:hypothetical protein
MVAGVVIVIVGCLLSFTPWGTQLDPEKKLYRTYTSLLGLKTGKWSSLKSYPFIAILSGRTSETIHGGRTPASVTISEKYYDIYLLSASHRDRLLVKRFKDSEQSKKEIRTFAKQLGVEIVAFNPKVSQATRHRKR